MSLHYFLTNRDVKAPTLPLHHRQYIQSSQHLVESYKLHNVLSGHTGCVNSVLFSNDGERIITGSDDLKVNMYSTHTGKLLNSLSTIHTNNIFYAKDIPQLEHLLITCAADGRVVLTDLNRTSSRNLFKHRGRAHRIALVPQQPNEFYSCGEDGNCCLFDIRTATEQFFGSHQSEQNYELTPVTRTLFKNVNGKKASIYTVGVNPRQTYEVALGGQSSHVSLFDSRYFSKPFAYMCPVPLSNSNANVTGLKYNYDGTLLLASYNDENIYTMHLKLNKTTSIRKPSSLSKIAEREIEIESYEVHQHSSPSNASTTSHDSHIEYRPLLNKQQVQFSSSCGGSKIDPPITTTVITNTNEIHDYNFSKNCPTEFMDTESCNTDNADTSNNTTITPMLSNTTSNSTTPATTSLTAPNTPSNIRDFSMTSCDFLSNFTEKSSRRFNFNNQSLIHNEPTSDVLKNYPSPSLVNNTSSNYLDRNCSSSSSASSNQPSSSSFERKCNYNWPFEGSRKYQNDDKDEADIKEHGYVTKFTGHRNNDTIKQVAFHGPHSEYVVSGSDCGTLFIWNTHTGKVVNYLSADSRGAINCLSSHPYLPYLASSGLDHCAKLWAPSSDHEPIKENGYKFEKLQKIISINEAKEDESSGMASHRSNSASQLSFLRSMLFHMIRRANSREMVDRETALNELFTSYSSAESTPSESETESDDSDDDNGGGDDDEEEEEEESNFDGDHHENDHDDSEDEQGSTGYSFAEEKEMEIEQFGTGRSSESAISSNTGEETAICDSYGQHDFHTVTNDLLPGNSDCDSSLEDSTSDRVWKRSKSDCVMNIVENQNDTIQTIQNVFKSEFVDESENQSSTENCIS